MEQLGAMELTSLLIEGGSRVLASAFNQRCSGQSVLFLCT
jgi:riboflavin biosynthesis pyrimidine reductase